MNVEDSSNERDNNKNRKNAEEEQDSKLRSGKIRKANLVERSLSSRCRDVSG